MKVQNLVVTEKYVKNGEEKKAYKTIGKLFTFDDGGQSVKLEMIPTGAWDGNANVYDIKPRQEAHGQQNHSGNSNAMPQQQYSAPQNQQQQYQQQQAPQVVQENLPF